MAWNMSISGYDSPNKILIIFVLIDTELAQEMHNLEIIICVWLPSIRSPITFLQFNGFPSVFRWNY